MRAAIFATILAASIAPLTAQADSPASISKTADAPTAAGTLSGAPPVAGETSVAATNETPEPPLIAYALELGESESPAEVKSLHVATTNLRAVTLEMSRHPPPSNEDCASTLGANRFADQYAQLAMLQKQLGNFEAAIEANKSALACEPRTAAYQASIASDELSLGHIAEARKAAERAYTLDPDDSTVREVRARVDFIQEHWADAIARFRLLVLSKRYERTSYADYSRCFLWLAQRRSGVRKPELPKRTRSNNGRGERWPAPILDTVRGELTEEDLTQRIRENDTGERREWLSEALFYVGELRLAENDAETARRYFAAVINLRVLTFMEYGMAQAELAKMREREAVAELATLETGTPQR